MTTLIRVLTVTLLCSALIGIGWSTTAIVERGQDIKRLKTDVSFLKTDITILEEKYAVLKLAQSEMVKEIWSESADVNRDIERKRGKVTEWIKIE